MIFVSGIELPPDVPQEEALAAARKRLGLHAGTGNLSVYKRAIDARRKNITFSYTVAVRGLSQAQEEKITRGKISPQLRRKEDILYRPEEHIASPEGKQRPVICGFGPAGAFAALLLAEAGFCPIVLERGTPVEIRKKTTEEFLTTGMLNPESNIQFGEGGAGTFSDGKLFTRVGDMRCDYILERMASFADMPEICGMAHPHLGTDRLGMMMKNIRRKILACGGEILFETRLEEILQKNGILIGVKTNRGEISCDRLILACGHSARDTFRNIAPILAMEPKPFAMGLRIEHRREDIDVAMFGSLAGHPLLGSAEYRLISKRTGVFSFCMCPGGQVMAAASEEGYLVTNGMSKHNRSMENSNAALVLPVAPPEGNTNLFWGIELQRSWEKVFFEAGGREYMAPAQRLGDFLENRKTEKYGRIHPSYPIGTVPSDLRKLLPHNYVDALAGAVGEFAGKIRGYNNPDAILTGPETRTSSPVRILRREDIMSVAVEGVLPCGEGAGYAGGILSAACDGIRAAERSSL